MALMDKLKGMLKGREKQVKSGIDTVSNQVEKKVGPKHAAKVDDASDKAKEAVDKLSGTSGTSGTPASATTPDAATAPPATTPPPVTPPAETPPPA